MRTDALALPRAIRAGTRPGPWLRWGLRFGGVPDAADQSAVTAEQNLVARARAGDPDSFRILVERHQRAAFTLALRILHSSEDAEDVAQEAFLRSWRALGSFRGESSFSTWILRIVARCAFDHLARGRRRRERERPLDDSLAEVLPDPANPGAPDRAGLRLARLVSGLTEVQRAAVTLYYLQERSVEEVARTLEVPVGTVKTHLHRARAALRAAWMKEAGAEKDDELRGL